MLKVRQDYIDLIINEVKKKNQGEFSVTILQVDLEESGGDRGTSTLKRLINQGEATNKTLKQIADCYNLPSHNDFINSRSHTSKFKDLLVGIWESYRFSRHKNLRRSSWVISYDEINGVLAANQDTTDGYFSGELSIDSDFLLKGKLSGIGTTFFYSTFLKDDKKVDRLIFNYTYKKDSLVYFSQEILYKVVSKVEPKIISEPVKFNLDHKTKKVTNNAYLAYLLLTSLNHSRTPIYYNKIEYEHSVYISCPVRSLFDGEKERFDFIKETLKEICSILEEDPFNFKGKVFCELINEEYGNSEKDEVLVLQEAQENLKKTHFIGILPKDIESRTTGAYFEMYTRIAKNLPCIIFCDETLPLPHIAKAFVHGSKKQNNVAFKRMPLEKIAGFIKSNGLNIFNLNFKS